MAILAEQVGAALKARQQTLATAESCTGGLIGHLLTEVSGSSAYYQGGVISYANEVKQHILGVQENTLMQYGAVSEQTAREMAGGVKRLLKVDYALSVTGIAGPGGGSPEKPVGLTYIGLAYGETVMARRFVWPGDRSENKLSSAEAALTWLLEVLTDADSV